RECERFSSGPGWRRTGGGSPVRARSDSGEKKQQPVGCNGICGGKTGSEMLMLPGCIPPAASERWTAFVSSRPRNDEGMNMIHFHEGDIEALNSGCCAGF
ncbi:hypothetical protein ATANTOWER_026115, partial [Ataeniobius toweri]|nr:hypothetical protein [Ataeniobius toweri]